jgi:hypothetical protein
MAVQSADPDRKGKGMLIVLIGATACVTIAVVETFYLLAWLLNITSSITWSVALQVAVVASAATLLIGSLIGKLFAAGRSSEFADPTSSQDVRNVLGPISLRSGAHTGREVQISLLDMDVSRKGQSTFDYRFHRIGLGPGSKPNSRLPSKNSSTALRAPP